MRGLVGCCLYEIAVWVFPGSILRHGLRNRLMRDLLQSSRHGFRYYYLEMSLTAVNKIIVVTYCSRWNQLSLSLVAVNETPLMARPYVHTCLHFYKQDGAIRPILYGEVWRRCFASLTVNATPILNEAAKLFTSSYDNFIQRAGIRDGASHCESTFNIL